MFLLGDLANSFHLGAQTKAVLMEAHSQTGEKYNLYPFQPVTRATSLLP